MKPALLLLVVAWASAVEVQTTVEHVTDGDTIRTPAGVVRLRWIDTPESHDNSHGQDMPEGHQAAEALRALLPVGKAVTLWAPEDAIPTDRYKRLLAIVIVGQTSAQEAQIAAGWTPYWRKYGPAPAPWADRFMAAQAKAEVAKAGAWVTAAQYMRDKANETTAKQTNASP